MYSKHMKLQKLTLIIVIGVLIISIVMTLRGITFIGEPQTWAYKYGWQSLAVIICLALGLALGMRKNNRRLSNWAVCLTVTLLISNVLISSIFR